MQFLDIEGLRALWTKIQEGDAKAKTTVEGQTAHATNPYISVSGAAVTGTGADGHTNYVVSINNAASPTDIQNAITALKGDATSTGDTLGELEDRIEGLESGALVTVEKLATAESGYAASYVVKQNNAQVGATINIPKDFLVKSASVETVETADSPYSGAVVGDKYIDFVVNTTDVSESAQHIYLPVNELVDVYTGGNGIEITASNVVNGVVDSTSESFLTVGANGFKLSGVQSAINTAKSDVIGTSSDAASADTVNGAKAYADAAVAAAADDYANAAQGALADTALQSVSASGSGYVTASVGAKDASKNQAISVSLTTASVETSGTSDGLAVASDVKSYVDGAVSAKNVSASGETGTNALVTASASNNEVTVGSTTKLQNAVASAESALQGVQVNSADLTVDANHKVNISIAEGTTNGTLAVNGTDVAVHGLGSAAYTAATDYATAAQGGKADSALQSVSHGTDSNYVTLTVGAKDGNQDQALSASATLQPLASADSSHMGLAEASDAKAYIDGKIAALDADLDASGTAANSGIFVVSGVTEVDGVITSIDSQEVEQAGAAAAAEARLRGATDAAGYVANDTLAALRNELNSMTGGQGSIASQIQTAIEGLDSSITASASRNAVEAEPDVAVFTTVSMVDGSLDSTTSAAVLIGGIPVATVNSICSSN